MKKSYKRRRQGPGVAHPSRRLVEVNKSKKNTQQTGERIQKVLANLGVASRREVERLILAGEVLVDKKPATLGQPLLGHEMVEIKGQRVMLKGLKSEVARRVIAYYKPLGYISTRHDPQGRPTIFSQLPKLKEGRWISIGRLDINTSGLLLLTNDGQLANQLMHPKYQIEREYLVRVFGQINEAKLSQLEQGVELEEGMAKFQNIMVINPNENVQNHQLLVTLTEGKNREVRRMWEAVDCQVNRLKRVRYGSYSLPKTLKEGKTIDLTEAEIQALIQLVTDKKA